MYENIKRNKIINKINSDDFWWKENMKMKWNPTMILQEMKERNIK